MNRFGLGERGAPRPLVEADDHESRHQHPLLTLAYLHWWDKGQRVPAAYFRSPASRAKRGNLPSSSAMRDRGILPYVRPTVPPLWPVMAS